ncbi:MAG: DUF4347 domain-containing protein, partial [Planctomycetes bacterium]|nr:DUF4347 domain-containing protein [Planctomycetota bacterium]
ISHGSIGQFTLGNESISSDNPEQTAEQWEHQGDNFTEDGNIYIFGCNVAANGETTLLNDLADLTHTDVFASDDLTGADGDWNLEVASSLTNNELAVSLSLPFDIASLQSYTFSLAVIDGTHWDDTLTGTAGDDTISGNNGNDILISGGGNDVMNGNNHADTFRFTGAQDGDVMTVDGGFGPGFGQEDTIDLLEYNEDQINDNGSTIIVDLGGGQSFTINYSSIEQILFNITPTTSNLADINVNEDAVDSVIDLFSDFDDIEDTDANLIYTITNNTNAGLFASTAIDGGAGTLTLDYAADQNGIADITVRATDTGGLWVETTFTLDISAVNDAPVLDN